MKEQSKNLNYILNTNDIYCLKLDNIQVEIEYCKTNKTFKDCMINILKSKI